MAKSHAARWAPPLSPNTSPFLTVCAALFSFLLPSPSPAWLCPHLRLAWAGPQPFLRSRGRAAPRLGAAPGRCGWPLRQDPLAVLCVSWSPQGQGRVSGRPAAGRGLSSPPRIAPKCLVNKEAVPLYLSLFLFK